MQPATKQDLNNFNQQMVGNTQNTGITNTSTPGVFTGASSVNFLGTTNNAPSIVTNANIKDKVTEADNKFTNLSSPYQTQKQNTDGSTSTGNGLYGVDQETINNFKAANPGMDFTPEDAQYAKQADMEQKSYYTPESQQAIAGFEDLQKNNDTISNQYLQYIKDSYKQMQDDQKIANSQAQNNALLALGIQGGSGSPTDRNSYVQAIIDQGQTKLKKLQLDEQGTYLEALKAKQAGDLQLYTKKVDQLDKIRDAKIEETKAFNQKIQEQALKAKEEAKQAAKDSAVSEVYASGVTDPIGIMKALQAKGITITAKEAQDIIGNIVPAGLDDLVKQLRSSGAPSDVIQNVLSAKSINDAYKAAGSYATSGGTGQLGLYNRYAAETIAQGQTPMGMGDFFAALKPKNLGASGLDPSTLAKVQTISNKFDTEQVVKDYNTIATQIDAVNNLGNTPTDDIQRIYAFAKVMDPNSAVREGEYSTIQAYSTALLQKMGLNANRVFNNDGFLTTEARNFLQNTLQNRLSSQEKAYNNVANETARKINNITGKDDGKDYITDYSKAFPTMKEKIEKEKQAQTNFDSLMIKDKDNTSKAFQTLWKQLGHEPTANEFFEWNPDLVPQGNQSFNSVGGDTNPAKGIVLGVNIAPYATDPKHEQKIASIVEKIPDPNTFNYDMYIKSIAPQSKVTGDMIKTASSTYGVDPRLVLAIIQNDSSFGTKGHGAKNNNPGNIGQFDKLKGTVKGYRNLDEGVLAVAKWLANHKTNQYA